MITGSHHQQIYWYATGRNRLLGQLPGAYLIAEKRWIPRRSAVLHPPGETLFSETGHWNSTCIACHTTNGKPEFDTPFGSQPIDTQVVDSRVTEFGIACEACHGPSTGHAAANRSPIRRYVSHLTGRGDPTTVLPPRLDPRRSSEVCGQCHGVWEFYDAAGERQANSAGLPFRPGDELTRTRFLAQPTRNLEAPTMQALLGVDPGFVSDSFWPDGMIRVSGREYNGLIESPCFKDARDQQRTLSCFSCHAMHQPAGDSRAVKEWADDQLAPGMAGNQACLQCHQAIASRAAEHTKHQPAVGRQLLLQLPHAVHELRVAEDDPQPPDQQSVCRSRRATPGVPTRAISVISTRRWRGPASTSRSGTVRSGSPRPLTSAISRRRCSGR